MLVFLLCALSAVYALCALWSVTSRRRRLPPLARGALPLLGHANLIFKNHTKLYSILMGKIGRNEVRSNLSAFTLRFGILDYYVIVEPDFAQLLMNTCLKKDRIYRFFEVGFGKDGLLTAKEPVWRQHRKLLNPIFNQKILNTYLIALNIRSRRFIEELTTYAGKGPFEHLNPMSLFILDLAITNAVGDYDIVLRQKCWHLIDVFSEGLTERFMKFWLHSDFIYGFSELKKRQDHIINDSKDMLTEVIEKRKQVLKENRGSVYLDHLLELAEDGALPYSKLEEELCIFVVGAADTTSTAFTYILLAIGTYPHIQQKILDEIDEVFGDSDRDVDKLDIPKLKYMEAVIKETLRLYPAIPMVLRELEKDLVYNNYTLPAGSRCAIGIAGILRHAVWGPDAEQFRPERWLAPAQLPPAHAFAAFGLGKRSCIGGNYAMMMLKTALVHVLRHYRVSGDVTKLKQKIGVVLKPASGCSIQIERRHSSNLSQSK